MAAYFLLHILIEKKKKGNKAGRRGHQCALGQLFVHVSDLALPKTSASIQGLGTVK
jgi:hypothetical protein